MATTQHSAPQGAAPSLPHIEEGHQTPSRARHAPEPEATAARQRSESQTTRRQLAHTFLHDLYTPCNGGMVTAQSSRAQEIRFTMLLPCVAGA